MKNIDKNIINTVNNDLFTVKNKSTINSKQEDSQFFDFYKSMQAPRKTPSELANNSQGIDKAVESLNNAMDFATQIVLASTRNMGLPSDNGNDNTMQEITNSAKSIAEMMATKANVQAQMEVIKQQQNPHIDLISLKDSVIEYDDSKRKFSNSPVIYNYQISHDEKDDDILVDIKLSIYDEKGNIVKTIKQNVKSGNYSYEWDGNDNNGNKVIPGEYNLETSSSGYKIVDDQLISFSTKSSSSFIKKVDGIKIEKGVATAVIIDDNIIDRNNIIKVHNIIDNEVESKE